MFTISQDVQTGELASRIMELQSALFFTESASLVKLPTHIISDVEMDEAGNIWFAIPMPAAHLDAIGREIPARLEFFKKGKEFFVKVKGTAHLITEKEVSENAGLSGEMVEKIQKEGMMGVKIVISASAITDNTPKPAHSWLKSSRSQLSGWLF